jgi:hypothetical protein
VLAVPSQKWRFTSHSLGSSSKFGAWMRPATHATAAPAAASHTSTRPASARSARRRPSSRNSAAAKERAIGKWTIALWA